MKKNLNNGKEDFKVFQKNADLSSMFGKQEFFNPYGYYYKLYNKFPHRHWFKEVNKQKLLEILATHFDLQNIAIFKTHIHNIGDVKSSPGVSAYILANELLMCFPSWEFGNSNDVQLYFSDEVNEREIEKITDIIKKCFTDKSIDKKDVLLLMQNNDKNLYFSSMSVHSPVYNLELNYNDDLMPLNELLLHRLNKIDDKGLVVFYGKSGTGKTSYVRYLASHVGKQKLFVPANFIYKIGSAEFLNLLNDYHNAVLIIEDADTILKKRSNDQDHVIVNLLSLADGVLSDFFHLQIICTFNSDISELEPALLRKGRLIGKYFFKELSLAKTIKLCEHLRYKFVPTHEMSLADIYHLEERDFQTNEKIKAPIGFK